MMFINLYNFSINKALHCHLIYFFIINVSFIIDGYDGGYQFALFNQGIPS